MTLRDVAGRAGVSITTVSRVLNGRESGVPIRDETRDRVLAIAAELGYKPNRLARALRGSRSSLMGVIARDISDPFHIQVLKGVNEVTAAHDYRLFLGHVDYRPDVALTYGSSEGTRLALDHLFKLGHRRIICVLDPGTDDQRLRVALYGRFMTDHGLADGIESHVTSQPDPEPSYELGLRLFAEHRNGAGPTAIYATSDTIAIGLMQAAYRSGVPIPPLTTVSQSGVEMGPHGSESACEMIENHRGVADTEDVVLTPTLVVRGSTAPPPRPPRG